MISLQTYHVAFLKTWTENDILHHPNGFIHHGWWNKCVLTTQKNQNFLSRKVYNIVILHHMWQGQPEEGTYNLWV